MVLCRCLLLSVSSVFIAGITPGHAQNFPVKPIRVYSSFSVGTTADTAARVVAAALAERIKQPVIVENKLGAGGIVALSALKQAAPDGYTLGILSSSNTVQPALVKNIPVDPVRDFMPITNIYTGSNVMTVPTSIPVRTVAEFVSYAKANPEKIFYGSGGVGTPSHISGELLAAVGGFKMTHLPYKGSVEMTGAMLSGDVQVTFFNYNTPKPMIEAGKVRVIGVTSPQRWSMLPDVPTIAETFPGFDVSTWVGIVAPRGMPKEVFETESSEIRSVVRSTKIFTEAGSGPGGLPSSEFAQVIAADVEKWKRVLGAAGIHPE